MPITARRMASSRIISSLDSLTLTRYDAVPDHKAERLLRAMQATLESRHNTEQPYGDWGVLCAYPPFKRARDVRAKTAFAFRYHNGSDWPYLDGLYAEERLRRGLGGARYALTRWWEYLPRGGLGRAGGVLCAALRPRLAAAGLEHDAGGRRAEVWASTRSMPVRRARRPPHERRSASVNRMP